MEVGKSMEYSFQEIWLIIRGGKECNKNGQQSLENKAESEIDTKKKKREIKRIDRI